MMRVLLTFFLVFISSATAYAEFFDLPFTGIIAEKQNESNHGWRPFTFGSSTGVGGFIGGPGASDNYGFAGQFVLSQETYLSTVNFNAFLFNYDQHTSKSVDFDFKLYGGDTTSPLVAGAVPNYNNLLFTSTPVSLNFDLLDPQTGGADIYNAQQGFNNLSVSIDRTLQPGTYWLYTDGKPLGNGGFVNERVGAVVTPEPSTYLLLLCGLLFIGMSRLKKFLPRLHKSGS